METKLTIVIIDDEVLAREVVKNYLKSFSNLQLVAECSNGFEGVKVINELNPDLLFLDIQMPKLNGFEMLELIDKNPYIIFATAYDHYAIKAFEVSAIDYLLKPFSLDRFSESITKVLKQYSTNSYQNDELFLKSKDKNRDYLDKIVIKDSNKILLFPLEEVIFLESADDYVTVNTLSGKYLKQKTMKYFEENLNPTSFIRVHRSYIVNTLYIKSIDMVEKESYRIKLKNNITIPVSKTGISYLKEFLNS